MDADERFPRKRCQQLQLRPSSTRTGAQDYDIYFLQAPSNEMGQTPNPLLFTLTTMLWSFSSLSLAMSRSSCMGDVIGREPLEDDSSVLLVLSSSSCTLHVHTYCNEPESLGRNIKILGTNKILILDHPGGVPHRLPENC